ncbi:MAG TPA: hypothetical protein VF132_09585 [Rudaea sp.]
MSRKIGLAAALLAAALLAACGKSPEQAHDAAPLAFVPADTPYVYANIDPMPAAVTDQWSKKMQAYWPIVFGMYDRMLTDSKHIDDRSRRIATALIDEIKTRDNWDKLRELGFKPDMRLAAYGVGLVPVLRVELGDPDKFRATIARIETKIGEKIPVGKTGSQEYWRLGNEQLAVLLAIEGKHLVATFAPTNASDPLKQQLLGLTAPAQTLEQSGALQAIAKQYKYTNYGTGYVDFERVTERIATPGGSDQEFAAALGATLPGTEPACKTEYLQIAHKFPRIVVGSEELTAQRVRIGAQAEIEPALAQQILAATGPAPGTGAPGDGVMDVSVALPLLKLRDFWVHQAEAVQAAPFACPALAQLNTSFRESKQKLDTTLPPPFSDLTGARFVLTRIELAGTMGAMPDVSGKLLLGSTNPTVALAMAQLALPQLKDLKLAADGKPVAIPKDALPPQVPALFAAMSDKAIALSAGAGEEATLTAFLNAPAAANPVFARIAFSGKFYSLLANAMDKAGASLPPEQRAHLDEQKQLFALYERWLKSGEMDFSANAAGISFEEVVEMNAD